MLGPKESSMTQGWYKSQGLNGILSVAAYKALWKIMLSIWAQFTTSRRHG